MLRFFILEVLLPILLFSLVRSVMRSIFQAFKGPVAPSPPTPIRQTSAVQPGGELKKDPVCGTYVSPSVSVSRKVDGQLVYFCSNECRDKYHAA
jgi:YHS domain-containing protein